MLKQSEIMHQVAQIALSASSDDFDELILEVEINRDGGTVGGQLRQITNGVVEYPSMWDPDRSPNLMDLSYELQDEIKRLSGGELTKYTVRIDKEGTARATFEYDYERQS